MKRKMFNNTVKVLRVLMLAAACFVIIAGACELHAVQTALLPGMDQTVQYILNLVNSESGATRSLQAGETRWTYSMALAGPCNLALTEEVRRINSAVTGTPTPPVSEITHYLIPAADLDFGKFGTRLKLGHDGVMHVVISTQRATIRRWHGDSGAVPQNASVEYEAPVTFGKPDVDIFDASVRLENALKHLASLCRTAAVPHRDPFRPH
jgi:hypothetical protein